MTREATIRGGTRSAHVGDELKTSDIQAIVDASILNPHAYFRRMPYSYHAFDGQPDNGTNPNNSGGLTIWNLSANCTFTCNGNHIVLAAIASGTAQKSVHVKEESIRGWHRPWAAGGVSEQYFRFPWIMSCWLTVNNKQNPTATSYVGIGCGTHNNGPEAPLNADAPIWSDPPLQGVVQLRLVVSTMTWELAYAPGDFSTSETVTPLAGVNPAVQGHGNLLRLEWDPTTPSLKAYIDDTLGATVTDANKLPGSLTISQSGHAGHNLFATTGSSTSANIQAALGPMLVTWLGHLDVPA